MTMMTVDDIAVLLKLSREYVRDKLVKRADFPRPCLAISQKQRRWDKLSVDAWIGNSASFMRR